MDLSSGTLSGFFAGLSVLGGSTLVIVKFLLTKHMKALEENHNLKAKAITQEVKESALAIKLLIERQAGDFRVLQVKVDAALKSMIETTNAQTKKYDVTVTAIKRLFEKSELRFQDFQKELTETRFMVERIKKSRP